MNVIAIVTDVSNTTVISTAHVY